MTPVRNGLLALLALLATGLAPDAARAAGGTHPYFHDGGALHWYHTYAEARRAAEREGKLIFIESGRPSCGSCAKLCRNVLAHRSIRGRLGRVAVGLVSHCDAMEPIVARLFRQNLYRPKVLPLVGFVTPGGRWVTGFFGSRSIAQFSNDLDRASRVLRRVNRGTRVTGKALPPAAAHAPARKGPPVRSAGHTPSTHGAGAPCPDAHASEACPGGNCHFEGCAGGDCGVDPEDPCAGFARPRLQDPCPPTPTLRPVHASPSRERPAAFPPRRDADQGSLPPSPERRVDTHPRGSGDLGMPFDTARSPDGDVPPRSATAPASVRTPPIRSRDDTPLRPAGTSAPTAKRKAEEAAARGQWGTVLRLTADIPEFAEQAEQARQWARHTIETSARMLLAGRLDPARKGLEAVATEFEGYAAAVDAERGLEALKLVEELRYLSKGSALRAAARARAHERMRGSRWARLFRDAP